MTREDCGSGGVKEDWCDKRRVERAGSRNWG